MDLVNRRAGLVVSVFARTKSGLSLEMDETVFEKQ